MWKSISQFRRVLSGLSDLLNLKYFTFPPRLRTRIICPGMMHEIGLCLLIWANIFESK